MIVKGYLYKVTLKPLNLSVCEHCIQPKEEVETETIKIERIA